MIFNRIIRTTFKNLGNISPFVALTLMRNEKNEFLLKAPCILLNFWVQVIMPSLSALLTNPARKMLCNRSPFLRSLFLDQSQNKSIFLNTPRSLHKVRIQDFLPPMQALNISASIEAFGNLLPVSAPVLLHSYGQLLVFFSCPVAFVSSILVFCRPSFVEVWILSLTSDDLLLFRHRKVISAAWWCLVQEIRILLQLFP